MKCSCGKESAVLFEGGLCSKCFGLKKTVTPTEPPKEPKIVKQKKPEPFDVKKYQADYYHRNKERLDAYNSKYQKRRRMVGIPAERRKAELEQRGTYIVKTDDGYFTHQKSGVSNLPLARSGAFRFRLKRTADKWAEKLGGEVIEIKN